MGRFTIDLEEKVIWSLYYETVFHDYNELKAVYPFSSLLIPPTTKPSLASVSVIAVSKEIIEAVDGQPEDFMGEYSKGIHIDLPMGYWNTGCNVYGCKWIDESKFKSKDIHLFHSGNKLIENRYGYQMCVGTPDSFKSMKNVLLEAVKTADNTLVAYERVQCGISDRVILNAYSHGDAGKVEYQNDRRRYVPK